MRNCHLPRNRKVQLLISFVLFLAVAYNIYDHTLNRFLDMPDATHFSSGISTTGRRKHTTAYKYNQQSIPVSDKAIVTAKTRKENINWIRSFCQDIGCGLYAYTTDPEQPEEGLLNPFTTKGHEAAAYLTYIVDYYHDLPEFSIFIHGGEEQWHNDLFGSKTIDHLRRVRFEAVQVEGFVNLRCTTAPLCPDTWHPLNPQPNDLEYAYLYELFPSIYTELFNITAAQLPARIGHICCAQFIVSREMIRRRPLNDYKRILHWIAQTEVTDNYGIGLVMEKLWHIMFGKDPVHCPREEQCWCDIYGLCGPLSSGEILYPVNVEQTAV